LTAANLVEEINDFDDPSNWIIFSMAHIYHHFDAAFVGVGLAGMVVSMLSGGGMSVLLFHDATEREERASWLVPAVHGQILLLTRCNISSCRTISWLLFLRAETESRKALHSEYCNDRLRLSALA
jgi:hypothetical protein